ncbi:MAG TPA: penicillin-binding protein 1B, partial [Chromatiaceae bacterium]|nr:penicillin-binding protein 1B [Chromatiaceae bacterium]
LNLRSSTAIKKSIIWLDYQVRERFDGALWAVPAKVYARALELYVGAELSLSDVQSELAAMAYTAVRQVRQPGQYRRMGDVLELYSRRFEHVDDDEPAQRVRIEFAQGLISTMTDPDTGMPLPIVRLDPVQLGSLSAHNHQDRRLLPLAAVPNQMIDFLIAVEDRKFRQHAGIDLPAIARAFAANLRAGSIVQGGSTLTQQLVKNLFLSRKQTLWRKLNEAVMALLVEVHYSKNLILEAYLNEVYLGQEGRRAIHGVGLAAEHYFDRPLSELSSHDIALLVGMVKGPSYYHPRRSPQRARERRDQVLRIAFLQGLMDQSTYAHYVALPIRLHEGESKTATTYPAFFDLLRKQLRRDYREEDLADGGLRIFTTLDPILQHKAEHALTTRIEKFRATRVEVALEGAMVVSSVVDGEVLALVGGTRPRYAGFNRALDAVRPVGSLVKPIVYLSALQRKNRYSMLTELQDEPLELKQYDDTVWAPQNYDKTFRGEVTLRRALIDSLNVPTVRLGLEIGVPQVMATVRDLGVQRPLQTWPSALLGSEALSPVEVTQVYQSLASGGFYSPLRTIRAVLDNGGQSLARYPLTLSKVADPAAVYLLHTLLHEITRSGTARRLSDWLHNDIKVAGKTGTTDDVRDSWFVGYTNNRVVTVWLGNDNNEPIGLTGSQGAMRVWADFINAIPVSSVDLSPPDGVEVLSVDILTRGLAGSGCTHTEPVPFLLGSVRPGLAPCYEPIDDTRPSHGSSWWRRWF